MASQLIALVWFSAYRGSEALNMLVHGLSNVEALEAAESSVSRSSARDVRVLAERFESPGCQGAIKDANFKAWSTIVYPEHPWQGGRKAEVHRNTDIRVAYVRNQKAGSTYMEQSLRTLFQHDDFGVQMEEFEVLPWHGNHHQSNITDEWFVFTMVRDPLLTAHAAYLEVARRSQIMDESSHHDQRVSPRYRYMPCHEKEQRTRRFKMYLKELQDKDHLGDQAFHSYPQALKVNVYKDSTRSRRFDGIAKLEDLEHQLHAIQVMAADKVGDRLTYSAHTPPAVPAGPHSVPENTQNAGQPCEDVDFEDSELLQMFCDLYKVDYECFDYSLPRGCK